MALTTLHGVLRAAEARSALPLPPAPPAAPTPSSAPPWAGGYGPALGSGGRQPLLQDLALFSANLDSLQ